VCQWCLALVRSSTVYRIPTR